MAKDQFSKLLWLVDTIYRSKEITFAEINCRWKAGDKERKDIPLRSFHNHRAAIAEMFGIDISCHKNSNEYYIEDTEDLVNNKLKMWLLNSFSVSSILQENVNLKNRVIFEDVPVGMQFMEPILRAMEKNHQVIMDYQSYDWSTASSINVEPYFLRLFKHRWYLIGKNTEREHIRNYPLDRIQKITVTENKFNSPKKFTAQEYFYDYYGIITDDDLKTEQTILKITSEQAPYLRNLPLHHSQKEIKKKDNYSLFELDIRPTYDFVQQLLSYGSALEVIKPIDLRDTMIQEIKGMALQYQNK